MKILDTFKIPLNNLSVCSKTGNAKYGVIAHVIRSTETAQKSEIQKLTFDMPHKVSLADGK